VRAGLAAATLGAATAAAAETGPYISGSVGGFFRENTETAPPFPLTRDFDPGLSVNLAAGYQLPEGFRVELEFGYAHNTVHSDRIGVPAGFGLPTSINVRWASGTDGNRYTSTLNLFYERPIADGVAPYVGGGIGGALAEGITGHGVDNTGAPRVFAGGQSTRGVAILEGGVAIKLTEAFALVPAYRYERFFGGGGQGEDEASHVAKIGLRYKLQADPEEPSEHPSTAPPHDPGYYVAAGGDGIFSRDNTSEACSVINRTVTIVNCGFSYRPGYAFDVALGYRYSERWRVEVEFAYMRRDVDSFLFSGFRPRVFGGSDNIFAGTATGFYDFPTGTAWTPYVGLGMGVASVRHTGSDTDTNLSLVADVGVAITLAPPLEVVPGYRLRWINTAQGSNPGGDDVIHTVRLAFRYSF
jgi:opacity protein-like surface antigen